eukprot:TRINITY_DN7231_c0_g1_i1.p1 TRINITY_DN7231_c0_g1~~TRINITY_DN7231_c0_g1_i1.p1  ORF type:complete len:125 (-),score=37.24 TRINITY_DN7231_c0_g1_i1:204-524(-)
MLEELYELWSALNADVNSGPFRSPVTGVSVTDNEQVIRQPMDMITMCKKITNSIYGSHQEFLDDLRLLRDNAYLYYSSRFPNIPPMADHLISICVNFFKLKQFPFS